MDLSEEGAQKKADVNYCKVPFGKTGVSPDISTLHLPNISQEALPLLPIRFT